MPIIDKNPILVTGAQRSGSTWVGQMIARDPDVGYIHEPFSINPGAGICGGQYKYWFTYICDGNAAEYTDHFARSLEFRCSLKKNIEKSQDIKSIYGVLLDWIRQASNRLRMKRPLVKDPLALYSSEWLARTFNMAVIVMIRHPAAFAGSLKYAGWPHPFKHFLVQPLLMRDHLAAFTPEIEKFATEDRDIVDQAILLWNLTHTTIVHYQQKHSEWLFVRHEDAADDPLGKFGEIYNHLELDYSEAVKSWILEHSDPRPEDIDEDLLSITRDSKSTISSWKKRLSEEEIQRVKSGTEALWSEFYGNEDW